MLTNNSIRLFRIRGIDVFVHWSWFLVAAFEITNRQNAYGSPIWNVLEYLALFAIVLLHEFGHALACRQVGGEAIRIMLWPLGGVASISPPQRPEAMLWSIAAGPLVNVILVPVLLTITAIGSSLKLLTVIPDIQAFLHSISIVNGVLLVFNLLPIYPLDGGQILRSLLWFLIGRARSLLAAALLGFVGVLGIVLLAIKFGSVWFAVMGAFIALNCWNGWEQARALMRLENAPRHSDYRCPVCQANALRGKFWKCDKCAAVFDTFDTHATCPSCGAQFGLTKCLECNAASPFPAWKDESVMNQFTSTHFESPGIKPLVEPLYQGKAWIRVVAVLTIAAGILTSLTVVGIVVAWIPVWAGVALYQSASRIEEALLTGKSDNLTSAFSKLRLYFQMTAVTWLLAFGLVLFISGSLIAIILFSSSLQPKNEANAIANIRKINAAQENYLSSAHRYGSLQELVNARLVDRRLLEQNAGYRLQIETQKDGYMVLASALTFGGRYDYYSFTDAVVRYSSDSRKAPPGLSTAPVN
jgi:Zn-dependent protease